MNMIFTVKLADKRIQIKSIHSELKDFFKEYLVSDGGYDFAVSWGEEEILLEQKHSEENHFSPMYLETLVALRKIAEVLPQKQCLLMHGASIAYHDKAYLFTAASGTGKSTHIRLWRKFLGKEVEIVNGDKPFLSIEKSKVDNEVHVHIHGTPWAGKENWQKNHSFELHGICFLNRGKTNMIRQMEPSECLPLILNQIYLPESSISAEQTLALIDLMITNVPLYYLECDVSEDAVRCSFETMTGLPYISKIID